MFEIELTGIEPLLNLKKNVRTEFKEKNGKMVREMKAYFKDELAKLDRRTTHTIIVSSLAVKPTAKGLSISVKYDKPSEEDDYEEQKKEYERLLKEKKAIQETLKNLANKIAERRRRNSKSRKQLQKLEARHDALAKQLGRTNFHVRNYKAKIKSYGERIASDSFSTQSLEDRYLSLQDGIEILEKAIVDSKPVPVEAASGAIVIGRLSLETVLKNQSIPDYVRSQYLVKYIVDKFFEEHYKQALFEVVIDAMGD